MIEDDPEYRWLLRRLIGDCFVIEEANCITAGLRMMARLPCFDLVLLDLSLPDSNREHTLARVIEEHPDQAPIILSGYEQPAFISRMIELGARGYLVKGVDDREASVLRARLGQLCTHVASCRKLRDATEIIHRTKLALLDA